MNTQIPAACYVLASYVSLFSILYKVNVGYIHKPLESSFSN
jgi:hypothetical protein